MIDEVLAIPANVRPLDDERARFYLDNRSLIETWADLRTDAAAAIIDRLSDLAATLTGDLEALAEEDAEVTMGHSNKHDSLDLSRRSWHRAGAGSPIRVSLESEPRTIGNKGALHLFVCLRLKTTHPDVERWAEPARSLAREVRASLQTTVGPGWVYGSSPKYPIYRYFLMGDAAWTLESIVEAARSDLLRLWEAVAPRIDALLVLPPSDN